MVKNIEVAKKLCYINQYEEKILLCNKRPIVLLEKKETSNLPDIVAFNMKKLGIMLPYTPLHYLLFQNDITCLVMTSGNISNSPIQFENEKAIENLGTIADYFLMHNRDINIPVEDSVVKTLCNNEIVVRMARGYTPFIFPMNCNIEMLALGAEGKSTFCLTQNQYLYMSQYIGDLKNYDTYINFEKAIDNMMSLLNFKPELIVHDMYTTYQSSKYALNNTVRKIPVQHHHAHMVSCMVEHKLFCPVIGVIFDGTGLGVDGNIWGGEFLIGTRKNFIRVGHFRYVTIQGGDKSIKNFGELQ
jgi:hydrogenase maturation protein HypF